MGPVDVSCNVPSSESKPKKRKRQERKHMTLEDDVDLSHCSEGNSLVKETHDISHGSVEETCSVETAVNVTSESVTMEATANGSLSCLQRKRRGKKTNKLTAASTTSDSVTLEAKPNICLSHDLIHGHQEATSLSKDSPSLGGSDVQHAVGTPPQLVAVEEKSNADSSRSQRKRSGKKVNKQTAIDTTVDSASVEIKSNTGLSHTGNHGCLEGTCPSKDTAGTPVEPAGNTIAHLVTMEEKFDIGLSNSHRKRPGKKISKQTAVNNIAVSVTMEAKSTAGLSHDANHGCLEVSSSSKDTSHVEPVGNATPQSITMEGKSNTGLSRSLKRNLKRKGKKQAAIVTTAELVTKEEKSNFGSSHDVNHGLQEKSSSAKVPLQGGSHVGPVVSGSATMGAKSNIALSHDANHGSLKGNSLKDTLLQGGSYIEPAGNAIAQSITMEEKSNTTLTRSQKIRRRKKLARMEAKSNISMSHGANQGFQEETSSAKDTCLLGRSNVEPAFNTTAEPVEMEEISKISMSKDVNHGCLGKISARDIHLEGGSCVKPAINTTTESVSIEEKPITTLSRSQRKRLKQKLKKQKKREENADLHVKAPDISVVTSQVELNQVNLQSHHDSRVMISRPSKSDMKADMPVLLSNSDFSMSQTKRKRRKMNIDLSSSSKIDAPTDISIRTDVGEASLRSDLCSSLKKKKSRKKKKLKLGVSVNGVCASVLPQEGLESKSSSMLNGFQKNVKEAISTEEIVPSLSHLKVTGGSTDVDVTAKDDHLQKLNITLERAFIRPKKKLLILDINGLLADITKGPSDGRQADFRVAGKRAFKRPYCEDFLNFCFRRFDVGVWSSRTKINAKSAVYNLMGTQRYKLLFLWSRSECTISKFFTLEDRRKPIVFKELRKLWDEQHNWDLPRKKGEYDESNTLLVDDSPYKALCNPAHTAIFPYSYNCTNEKDLELGPGGGLREYLERIAVAENVQKFVEKNPFGQPAITEAHPEWDFYSKVVSDLTLQRHLPENENSTLTCR